MAHFQYVIIKYNFIALDLNHSFYSEQMLNSAVFIGFVPFIFFFLRDIWSNNKYEPCFLLILRLKYFRNMLHFQFERYLLKFTIFGSLRWILKGQRTDTCKCLKNHWDFLLWQNHIIRVYYENDYYMYWCVHCTCAIQQSFFFFLYEETTLRSCTVLTYIYTYIVLTHVRHFPLNNSHNSRQYEARGSTVHTYTLAHICTSTYSQAWNRANLRGEGGRGGG